MSRTLAVALTLVVTLTACSSEEEPDGTTAPELVATEQPDSTPEGSSPLPEETEAAPAEVCEGADGVLVADNVIDELELDLDGDGSREAASLYFDDSAPNGCRALIGVDVEGDPAVPVWRSGSSMGMPEPFFDGAADLDGDGDEEIVLSEGAGASTQFLGLFDLIDGVLVRLQPPAGVSVGDQPGGLFPTGGSVGHVEAVDCLAPGQLVVSSAVPARGRKAASEGHYDVRRVLLSISEGKMFDGGTEEVTLPLEEVLELPEFSRGPLAGCGSA